MQGNRHDANRIFVRDKENRVKIAHYTRMSPVKKKEKGEKGGLIGVRYQTVAYTVHSKGSIPVLGLEKLVPI